MLGPGRGAPLLGLHWAGRDLEQADHLQRRKVHFKRDQSRASGSTSARSLPGTISVVPVGQRAHHPGLSTVLHDDRRQAQGFGNDDCRTKRFRMADLPDPGRPSSATRAGRSSRSIRRSAASAGPPAGKRPRSKCAAKPLRDCQFSVRICHVLLYDDHAPWPQARW